MSTIGIQSGEGKDRIQESEVRESKVTGKRWEKEGGKT